jgi:hypothetical protein
MSEPIDEALPLPPELPPELRIALQRAVAQSLVSLDSLRITLRRHVHTQRNRGASLGAVDAQIRELMAEADANAAAGDGVSSELSSQVAKWTRAFFSGALS